MHVALSLLLALTSPSLRQGPDDFDFLHGTWAMRKDGFSFTVTVEPILDGAAWQTTQTLDENNRAVATSILAFDRDAGVWTRTDIANTGARSTFVGVPAADGLALELRTHARRPMDPVLARLLYTPEGPDRFTLDWQSRDARDAPWRSRAEPFVHRRVERPDPPAGEGRIAFISNREGNWDIFTMAPDGSDLRNVSAHPANDHYPNWVAGGRRLAFRSQRGRDDGGWDRFEIDRDGTDAERTPERVSSPDAGTFAEVHPSGSYLVYAAERDGEQDLYVSRFDGGGERLLAGAPGLDYRPLWSPDGRTVLFVSERDGDAEVYSVGADGTGLRRLTESPGIDRYARWSPDGARIVFASQRDAEELELYVMNADGSDVRRLTENDAEDGEPCWSPDGTRVVFRSNVGGNAEVCVVDVESGAITNLTGHDAYDGEPVWSPTRR